MQQLQVLVAETYFLFPSFHMDGNVTGLVHRPYVLCLSQVRAVANPAEPCELAISLCAYVGTLKNSGLFVVFL